MTSDAPLSDASARQLRASLPDRSTWLAANAGSGKTRVLTDRVARLLLSGCAPQRILCLTYTKAAAAEMQNRLFKRLGEWAMMPDEKLRKELRAGAGPEDYEHFKKILRWSRTFSALGYATAWIAPNPFSAAMLSTGTFTRWAIIAHHVLHKGYDKVPGVPEKHTSKGFANGWRRRVVDWLDWIEAHT